MLRWSPTTEMCTTYVGDACATVDSSISANNAASFICSINTYGLPKSCTCNVNTGGNLCKKVIHLVPKLPEETAKCNDCDSDLVGQAGGEGQETTPVDIWVGDTWPSLAPQVSQCCRSWAQLPECRCHSCTI